MSIEDMKDRLKKQIEAKDYFKPLDADIVETIQGSMVKAYCETCRIVFLEIPVEEYNRLHDWKGDAVGQVNDKWFIETAIHFFQLQDHEIILDLEGIKRSISSLWRDKLLLELRRGNTVEVMMAHLFEHRERLKGRPI